MFWIIIFFLIVAGIGWTGALVDEDFEFKKWLIERKNDLLQWMDG